MKPPKNPITGWINLYKPLGLGSTQAVGRVKWLLRPQKIGHAGTLDPLATGVLPLALGKATKSIHLLMDARKVYEFSVTFGQRRATDDAEGEVVATSSHMPTEAEIRAILFRFTGEITQIPPIFSALKINGKRAYDLARAGEVPEMKARVVTVVGLELVGIESRESNEDARLAPTPPLRGSQNPPSDFGGGYYQRFDTLIVPPTEIPFPTTCASGEIELGNFDSPARGELTEPASPPPLIAHFRATVSKGTYIRSLGRDIAQALGTEGYISRLHRAAVGPFTDRQAISLDFLENYVHNPATQGESSVILPISAALDDIPALAAANPMS